MMKRFATFLLSLSGWKVDPNIPAEAQRCVMTALPHTSNWDLWYTRLSFFAMDIPMRFTIKREWMRFPFKLILGSLGALAIDRRPRQGGERPSYVDAIADLFKRHDRIAVTITPEGTRKLRTEWKTGFYYIALKAGVPICLGYLDYQRKIAGVGPVIYPSGDLDKDMSRMTAFYQHIPGKYPEKFSIDLRFPPNEENSGN